MTGVHLTCWRRANGEGGVFDAGDGGVSLESVTLGAGELDLGSDDDGEGGVGDDVLEVG